MPQIEIDGELLEQCENCGTIWDGYAQCNCWQMNFYDDVGADEADDADAGEADESGYETE